MTDNLRIDLSVKAEINLYYDLYVPEGIETPAPLLIAVHGYGAHKRYMMREARAVAGDRFVVAAIEAPHPHFRRTEDGLRVGYGWTSDRRSEDHIRLHHRFVKNVIAALDGRSLIDTNRIYIYGFSQACALNFRFAFSNPKVLAGVIGVCGGVPGDLEANERYQPFEAETLYLYGDDDEFYTQEQFATFDRKLAGRLPNYTSKHYSAKHEITDEMRSDIKAWLTDKIDAPAGARAPSPATPVRPA